MKPEYIQDQKEMFTKLDQNHHYGHRQLPPQPTLQHAYQMATGGKASEEGESRRTLTKKSSELITAQPISAVVRVVGGGGGGGGTAAPSSVNDEATIEISRRPRGRPPGSKNRPKPPVVITVDAEPSMSPYILELPCGVDLIGSVTRFCRKRNIGLCILTGSGTVSDVTLRQPSTAPGPNVIFHGRYDILSISATILHPNAKLSTVGSGTEDFTISLAGPQGQVVGGPVVGPLTSAGPVFLIGASFNNPLHQKLPPDDEDGGNDGGHHSPRPEQSGGAAAAEEPRGLSMYSCHMASDVVWAPAARQAPPPF